jgi:hypothetical protein
MNYDNETRISKESCDSAASSSSSKYNNTFEHQKPLRDKSSLSIDKLLPFIKEKSYYPQKPQTFLDFFKRARRVKEPQHVAMEFTKDLYGLLKMTEDITPKSRL